MAERRPEFTAAQVARIAERELGYPVPTDRVRSWIRLGRIQRNACGAIDGASVSRYLTARVGDDEDDAP